jgi:hypothetical protein
MHRASDFGGNPFDAQCHKARQRIPLWTAVITANSDGHLTGYDGVVGRSSLAK